MLRDTTDLCRVLDIPFSSEQLEAITAPVDRPSAIIAGAGSGKTTVMAARVVWLVGHEGIDPGAVLGLTFTRKAASELGHRVRGALSRLADESGVRGLMDEGGEPVVSTYHAYAGDLISEYGLLHGHEPDVRISTDASRFQRAYRAIASYPGPLAYASTSLPDLVADVLALDGQMAEHLVTAADVRSFDRQLRDDVERTTAEIRRVRLHDEIVAAAHRRDELVALVERYRAAKNDAGVVDFSDQMERAARLALGCPEVSQSQRDRFAVVLLDEYQDTSVAQRDLLQALFSGSTVADGRGHPVTAVGDPCQGIYGWRGAAASNLQSFLGDFPAATASTEQASAAPACRESLAHPLHLQVNRRSRAEILDVANRLARPFYAANTDVRPLAAAPDSDGGVVRAALHRTVEDEVGWVADEVVAARSEVRRQGAGWSEIAILVRTRTEIPALVAALRERAVPVEVVGLSGLLSQPEVGDVLAAMRVVADQTANADLLRLLTGPRWRIGPRDLALLGTRARRLAGRLDVERTTTLVEELERSVAGIDPTEIVSLADAVDSPDDPHDRLGYSEEARRRFAEVSTTLRGLRRRAGGSPVELVRHTISALGVDLELIATGGAAAQVARDNLAALIDAVADFVAAEPAASLTAVLAYLDAEERYNGGMEVAAPSEADAVKILTVHTAKGLEWDVVFVPFLSEGVFPSDRARSAWPRSARTLPHDLRGDSHDLPALESLDRAGHAAFATAMREDALLEEIRLGYVALTRARHLLVTSGHHWGRRRTVHGPSPFLQTITDWLREQAGEPELWVPAPEDGEDNPLRAARAAFAWPAPLDAEAVGSRREAARRVRAWMSARAPGDTDADSKEPDLVPASVTPPTDADVEPSHAADDAEQRELRRLSELDVEIAHLLAEARAGTSEFQEVPVPARLSTTALMAMNADPDGYARTLARPLPRPPAPAARFGTRFHAWVEARFGQQVLLADDDLPGRDDLDIADDVELAEVVRAFESGPLADRVPHVVEAAFTIRLAGQTISGRIDAVYRTDDGWEVVDWKTSRSAQADPLQLAVYRLAWAEMHGVPLEQVRAAFCFVRLGELVYHHDLPGRGDLERIASGAGVGSAS
ncbi:UNVERIFIED_CONTAM: hypothetical protein LK11_58420 [Mumia flava]